MTRLVILPTGLTQALIVDYQPVVSSPYNLHIYAFISPSLLNAAIDWPWTETSALHWFLTKVKRRELSEYRRTHRPGPNKIILKRYQ